MDLLRGKMERAMGDTGDPLAPRQDFAAGFGFGPFGGAAPASASGPVAANPPPRPSMADTLAATFGGNAPGTPAHVRQAYGKLKAFGL